MTRKPARPPPAEPPPSSIRAAYEDHGADLYYQQSGARYRNPHEPRVRLAVHAAVQTWSLDLSAQILDLACGSGEVTLALRELGATRIAGLDPYTGAAYLARTGLVAEPLGFAHVAAGALGDRSYGLVVCSYALHLAPASRLPQLVYQLARVTAALLVLTPHKRPELQPAWGLVAAGELQVERVRARLYRRP